MVAPTELKEKYIFFGLISLYCDDVDEVLRLIIVRVAKISFMHKPLATFHFTQGYKDFAPTELKGK